MVEIDRLPRITLSTFKPIFGNVARMREATEARLRERPPSTEEEAIAFREESVETWSRYLRGYIEMKGGYFGEGNSVCLYYKAEVCLADPLEIVAFTFKWEYGGSAHTQRVAVEARPSNLGLGSVYYFICPCCSELCRNLYTDGRVLIGRRGFRHTYSARNETKRVREILKLYNILDTPAKYPYRKEYYRGKITPFGRRMERVYNRFLKIGGSQGLFDKMEELWG